MRNFLLSLERNGMLKKNRKGGTTMQKKTAAAIALGALAGIGVGAAAVSCGASKAMTDLAMDRKIPGYSRFFNVSGKKKSDGGFSAARKKAMEALEALPRQDVTIRSADGLTLKGHLLTCKYPRRLIIAFHGWRSSWSRDFGLVAPFWLENHCNVLLVEQRAHGDSQGDYLGFGLLERSDCQQWAIWADRQNFGLPIYLAGISMGSTTVLMAAGLSMPESVRGIIADCGFTSPRDIVGHVAQKNLHLNYTWLRSYMIDRNFRKKIHMTTSSYSTLTAMKQTGIPVLFIHGTEDHFVPIEMTYRNYRACAARKRLVVVPGAGHAMSFYVNPEACGRAMREFWKEFDLTE